jgi:hypothetical protein
MDQKPSVCRAVHYVSYGTPGGEYTSECRAATITEVPELLLAEDTTGGQVPVGLCVMNPTGLFFIRSVPYDGSAAPAGGTWHWPERV